MNTRTRQSQKQGELRCAYCHGEFTEDKFVCSCNATYHFDCYETNQCSTIGCNGIQWSPQEPQTVRLKVDRKSLILTATWTAGTIIILGLILFDLHNKSKIEQPIELSIGLIVMMTTGILSGIATCFWATRIFRNG